MLLTNQITKVFKLQYLSRFFWTLLDIFVGSKTGSLFSFKSGKVHPDMPNFGPSQSDSNIFETGKTETGPITSFGNHVSRSQWFQKYLIFEVQFFFEMLKFKCRY